MEKPALQNRTGRIWDQFDSSKIGEGYYTISSGGLGSERIRTDGVAKPGF